MLELLAVVVTIVALAAFVVLAAAFVVVLRHASLVIAQSRDEERFRGAVEDLAERIDRSLGGVIEQIDAVRRHQVAADAIGPNLAAASDAVGRYAGEATTLTGPVPADEVRASLLAELERASRALEMVLHGCALLDEAADGPRELEAQTSIKRGYLNALHAREAITRHAADLAAARPANQRRWLSRRSG